jgi:hypothetical protein
MGLTLPLYPDQRLILSLFDYSGKWARPYIDAGYPTMLWDYKHEGCILQNFSRLQSEIYEAIEAGYIPHGLLAAPPCTDISAAGAQYWSVKDTTPAPEPYGPDWSISDYASALVDIVLILRDLFPWQFWAIENPPGRMEKLVPHIAKHRAMMFQPWEFGDKTTKRTVLWGQFNTALERQIVEPEVVAIKTRGRVYHSSSVWAKTGGKTEKTKTARSNTPAGFARSFFQANP